MTREELISSPEYWMTNAQIELYNCASKFMNEHEMNRKQLAEHLGVSKSYVTQLLSGDFDHRLSKFMELSIAFGYVPELVFTPIEKFIERDSLQQSRWNGILQYRNQSKYQSINIYTGADYSIPDNTEEKEAA